MSVGNSYVQGSDGVWVLDDTSVRKQARTKALMEEMGLTCNLIGFDDLCRACGGVKVSKGTYAFNSFGDAQLVVKAMGAELPPINEREIKLKQKGPYVLVANAPRFGRKEFVPGWAGASAYSFVRWLDDVFVPELGAVPGHVIEYLRNKQRR